MIYEFDRYINGMKMAEGVSIHRANTMEEAMSVAARIASKGPNGKTPVLVLRNRVKMDDTPNAAEAAREIERLREALTIIGGLKVTEFNQSNYTHYDVCELHENAVQAAEVARSALGEDK